jgi:hypothetical protein
MSANGHDSLAAGNLSPRDKRTSRVLDAIHMFEQKTSPVGSPTISSNVNQVKILTFYIYLDTGVILA